MSTHIKCTKCDFSASKRVVLIHVTHMHPENTRGKEIAAKDRDHAAYLEARRNAFPTSDTVSKKRDKSMEEKGSGMLANDADAADGSPAKKKIRLAGQHQPAATTEAKPRFPCPSFERTGKCAKGLSCPLLHAPRSTDGLMFRLLEKDVRQDRSFILQLFRHLVATDFNEVR